MTKLHREERVKFATTMLKKVQRTGDLLFSQMRRSLTWTAQMAWRTTGPIKNLTQGIFQSAAKAVQE